MPSGSEPTSVDAVRAQRPGQAGRGRRALAEHRRRERQVLRRGEVVVQAEALRHVPDPPPGAARRRLAEQADLATDGASRPSSSRISVVFPAPFAPSRPTTSPGRTSRSTVVHRDEVPEGAGHRDGLGSGSVIGAPRPRRPRASSRARMPTVTASWRSGRTRPGRAVPVAGIPDPPAPLPPPGAPSRLPLGPRVARHRQRAAHRGHDLLRRPARQFAARVEDEHVAGPVRPRRDSWSPAPPRRRPPPRGRSATTGPARLTGSTPVVGSSSTSRSGRCSMAAITPSFCRMPPDSCPASRPVARSSPARASSSAPRCLACCGGHAVGGGAERQVLGDRQVRVGARPGGQVPGRQRGGPLHPSAGRGERSGQAAEQGGAARSVAADDRTDPAWLGAERDMVEGHGVPEPDAHVLGAPPVRGGPGRSRRGHVAVPAARGAVTRRSRPPGRWSCSGRFAGGRRRRAARRARGRPGTAGWPG